MKAWELMRRASEAADCAPVASALWDASVAMRREDMRRALSALEMYERAAKTFGCEPEVRAAVRAAMDAWWDEEDAEDQRVPVGQSPAAGQTQRVEIVHFPRRNDSGAQRTHE